MDVTFEPKTDSNAWAGWVEATFKASFTDEHCPNKGDHVTLSTAGHKTLPTRLKRLQLHWPQNNSGFSLAGDTTWIHDVRNLTAAPLSYTFLSSPAFFGWWRFNRGDTVTITPDAGESTAVLQRMEASGRVNLNVEANQGLIVSNLFGAGVIRKVGAGDLEIVRTGGDFVNLEVQGGGTLTLHEQEKGDEATFESVLADAFVHFDASDINNFVFNDKGRISKWKGSAPKPTASATELTTNYYGSATCLTGHNAPLPRYQAGYSATGLGVVDFGPYRATSDADLETSGAAALQFTGYRQNFSEAFIVFADTDPLCRQCVFSESHNNTFPRGTYTGGINYDSSANIIPYTGAIVNWGSISRNALDVRVNGRLVPSTFSVGGKDLKVVSIDCDKVGNVQAGESMIGAFARGDKTHIGGVVVAEFIGFVGRKLSDAERQSVNRHLMRKWLGEKACEAADLNDVSITDAHAVSVPEGDSVRINHLTTESKVVKSGAGKLEVRGVRATANGSSVAFDVREGGLAFRDRGESAPNATYAADPLYHFDVSDDKSLTTVTEGGDTFVTAIRDQHLDSVSAVPMTGDQFTLKATTNEPPVATAPARPTLLANQVNGKPTMYFGARTDHNLIAKQGYQSAAGLYIPQADTTAAGNVFEGFVVIKGAYCIYPFATTKGTVTMYPNGWKLLHEHYSMPLRSGEWTVDGVPVNPYEYGFDAAGTSAKFVVIRFSATDMVPVNAIGIQDTHPHGIGGVNFGEWIVYNRRLTAQERRDTEAYLMKKWLNKDHPLDAQPAVSVAFADGVEAKVENDVPLTLMSLDTTSETLTKEGEGSLSAKIPDSVTTLDVSGGSFDERSLVELAMSKAAMHLDASDGTTLEFADDEKTKVSKWKDVRGDAYPFAKWDATKYADCPLLAAGAQNGLDVIDYGDTCVNHPQGKYDVFPNPGKAHVWSQRLKMREGFLVMRHQAYSSILGSTSTTHFHPDDNYLINTNLTIQHSMHFLKTNTEWAVDNELVSVFKYKWSDFTTTQYHVLSFAVTNSPSFAEADTFASDRSIKAGGQKLGEVLLFSVDLTPAERTAIRNHLIRKWNTKTIPDDPPSSLTSVSVASGASVSLLPGHVLSSVAAASGQDAIAGDVALTGDAATLKLTYSGPDSHSSLSIEGKLTLGETGTVVLDTGAEPFVKGEAEYVAVTAADGIEGSLSGWTIGGTFVRDHGRYPVSVRIDGNRILVKVSRPGMVILVK